GEYGVFVDGDYSRTPPKKESTMYLVRNNNGEPQLIMAMPVSLSFEDYSKKKDSLGTPLGKYPVKRIVRGLFGQLVANKQHPEFKRLPVRLPGMSYGHFPESIVRGKEDAMMTSAVLWLLEDRTIGAHGSNKIAGLGFPGSDGCIRASNIAIFYLLNFVKVGT